MAETYLIDTASVASGDFQEWANQSFDIAVNNVYPGVVVNQALSQEYIDQAIEVSKTNIMMGGRRLADLMVQIYGNQQQLFLQ